MTCGGIDDDDERMKRSGWRAMISALPLARATIAWCMVGTAVYQVGLASSIHWKNLSALKPGVQYTAEPAETGASTPAMRPWMWKSGMMLRPTSPGASARLVRMLRADEFEFY